MINGKGQGEGYELGMMTVAKPHHPECTARIYKRLETHDLTSSSNKSTQKINAINQNLDLIYKIFVVMEQLDLLKAIKLLLPKL